MRRYFALIAAAGLVLALVACSTPAAPSGSGTAAPTAESTWATLSTKSYQSWQPAPGFETTQPAKGPHGKFVQVFVDPIIAKTLSESGATQWPAGSMIVKDAYDEAGALIQIEYMQKTDQGWYFASFGTDGTVVKDGVKVEPCQKCHESGSDSVKAFKLP